MTKFNYYSSLYIEFKKHELKDSTFDKYSKIVENRIDPVFGERDIKEIRPSDIKKWLYSIDDVGAKSQRHYLGVLSGILQEALYDEVIDRNPVRLIKLPKYERPNIKPFNADEVHMIMNNTPNENYNFYLAIAFYTGMRSGEIIGLKKNDIDFKNRTIKVQRSRSRFGESTPKTKYSIREIPIIDLLFPYLLDIHNLNDHEYLFVTQYNKPYRDTNVFNNNFWIPSLKDLGIEYRRPYNTRHTYATNMLYNNLVTPIQLAQLLGHANTEMVYNVYVNYIEQNYSNFNRSISIYK